MLEHIILNVKVTIAFTGMMRNELGCVDVDVEV